MSCMKQIYLSVNDFGWSRRTWWCSAGRSRCCRSTPSAAWSTSWVDWTEQTRELYAGKWLHRLAPPRGIRRQSYEWMNFDNRSISSREIFVIRLTFVNQKSKYNKDWTQKKLKTNVFYGISIGIFSIKIKVNIRSSWQNLKLPTWSNC